MENYNPPVWNIHQVEVSLMDEEGYTGSLIIEVGGNISGLSMLDSVLQLLEDFDFVPVKHELNEKHITSVADDGYPEEISLFKGDEELIVDIDVVANFVVGLKIVGYREK